MELLNFKYNDIKFEIFNYLSIYDILNYCKTCKKIYDNIWCNDFLWKFACKQYNYNTVSFVYRNYKSIFLANFYWSINNYPKMNFSDEKMILSTEYKKSQIKTKIMYLQKGEFCFKDNVIYVDKTNI